MGKIKYLLTLNNTEAKKNGFLSVWGNLLFDEQEQRLIVNINKLEILLLLLATIKEIELSIELKKLFDYRTFDKIFFLKPLVPSDYAVIEELETQQNKHFIEYKPVSPFDLQNLFKKIYGKTQLGPKSLPRILPSGPTFAATTNVPIYFFYLLIAGFCPVFYYDVKTAQYFRVSNIKDSYLTQINAKGEGEGE